MTALCTLQPGLGVWQIDSQTNEIGSIQMSHPEIICLYAMCFKHSVGLAILIVYHRIWRLSHKGL